MNIQTIQNIWNGEPAPIFSKPVDAEEYNIALDEGKEAYEELKKILDDDKLAKVNVYVNHLAKAAELEREHCFCDGFAYAYCLGVQALHRCSED